MFQLFPLSTVLLHPMANRIAILGIHTGIGKTIATAVLAEAWGAHYWKPVQAGLEERDTYTVGSLITDGSSRVYPEAVALTQPLSPHAAAAIDGVAIDHTTFYWPVCRQPLLVETAGGVLSPISATATMADFVADSRLPALLVCRHYLGSINHTLMSIEILKKRGIHLLGLVVNGPADAASEEFITAYTAVPILARIPQLTELSAAQVAAAAVHIAPLSTITTTHGIH